MGFWKQIAALPNAHSAVAACFHDGKVYAFPLEVYTTSVYIYDPGTNTWSIGAARPAIGTSYAFSTTDDGVHLVYPSTGAHFAYDPDTDTWATRISTPTVDRVTAHHFTDADGLFYMAGGQRSGGRATAVHAYDPDTDTWASLADMPSGIAERAPSIAPGVLGSDGVVYLGHSAAFATGLIAYDPDTDTWASTAALPEGPGVSELGVSRLPSGIVLTVPHIHQDFTSTYIRRIDGLDPSTGTWSLGVIPDFPGSSNRPGVATEIGGLIYLLGGPVLDAEGFSSPTAASFAYQQNEAPTAPTPRTMVGGVTVSTEATNRAAWTFNDPNVGDSQSKFNLYYRPVGDTSWTTITKTTPNPWYDFTAGTLTADDFEWQLEVYDAGGLISPRTASAFFTAADPPDGPSTTYPINGQTVEQFETVVWSAAAQDSYQLRRVADVAGEPDTADVYFDTEEVVDTLTRFLAVEFETNDRTEHLQVRVKDGGLWSEWVDVLVEVSYTPPPAPTFETYPDPATGSLLLMITTPDPEGDAPAPAAAYVDIFIDDGAGEERKATLLPISTSWRYWTPISGRDYTTRIRVVAVAANGTTASSS